MSIRRVHQIANITSSHSIVTVFDNLAKWKIKGNKISNSNDKRHHDNSNEKLNNIAN